MPVLFHYSPIRYISFFILFFSFVFFYKFSQNFTFSGSYLFDRDGKYGSRFFCTQHFGMQGVAKRVRQAEERSKDTTPTKQTIPTMDEEVFLV